MKKYSFWISWSVTLILLVCQCWIKVLSSPFWYFFSALSSIMFVFSSIFTVVRIRTKGYSLGITWGITLLLLLSLMDAMCLGLLPLLGRFYLFFIISFLSMLVFSIVFTFVKILKTKEQRSLGISWLITLLLLLGMILSEFNLFLTIPFFVMIGFSGVFTIIRIIRWMWRSK